MYQRLRFTPAANRAIQAAAEQVDSAALGVEGPALLLGLLSQDECRAALLLQAAGISLESVRASWPELPRAPRNDERATPQLGPDLREGLLAAAEHLQQFSATDDFATEHLLLALLLSRDEAAQFLRKAGLSAAGIAAELQQPDNGDPLPLEEAAACAAATERDAPLTEARDPPPTDPAPERAPREGNTGLWRLLDAAANRAREALRVLEDDARFLRNDEPLVAELKHLRHELAALVRRWPAEDLIRARDVAGDVGTQLTTDAEQTRHDAASVALAAAKRLQEALRSLEEFSKLIDPPAAAAFKQLRYRSYALEQRSLSVSCPQAALDRARLYVLLDGRATEEAFSQLAQALVQAGVDVIQLRDKRLGDRELLARGRILRELTVNTPTTFIFNDRADLARTVQADGVHVGQEELPVAAARSLLPAGAWVGVSTHSLAQASQAARDGADYIGVGPTFPSQTKSFAEFTGLELLRAAAQESLPPAFAIGGITLENLDTVLATGIRRVAVSSAIVAAADPSAAAAAFRRRLDRLT